MEIVTNFFSLSEKELINEAHRELAKRFSTQNINESIHLNDFNLFKDYTFTEYQELIPINNRLHKAYSLLIAFLIKYNVGRHGPFQQLVIQNWGMVILPKSFGNLMIKPESFRDRLSELIQPVELNFPSDRDFCKKYYVLANDKSKAESLLSAQFRSEIKKIPIKGFYLEVYGNQLIIGSKNNMNNEELLAFASFASAISELQC